MSQVNNRFVSVSGLFDFVKLLLAAALIVIPMLGGVLIFERRLSKIEVSLIEVQANTRDNGIKTEDIRDRLVRLEEREKIRDRGRR